MYDFSVYCFKLIPTVLIYENSFFLPLLMYREIYSIEIAEYCVR